MATELAQPTQGGADDQIYVVTYFNGVQEEAVGLGRVRQLLVNPEERVEAGRNALQGGHYFPKQ